jgi:hypothetical protein
LAAGRPERLAPRILRYPHLAERPAAVYSQEDVRRVIAFASKRYVTVVPEFGLAGESGPVVEAYPEMACGATLRAPVRGRGVCRRCLTEIVELFPQRWTSRSRSPAGSGRTRSGGASSGCSAPADAAWRATRRWRASAAQPRPAALYAFDPAAGGGAAGAIAGGEAALALDGVPAMARPGRLAERFGRR